MPRLPAILHTTSEPLVFFGRENELALLDQAAAAGEASLVALVGPGGQGKTAIVQHWLARPRDTAPLDGLFFWSFYRGKDSDLCLRHLLAYAEGMAAPPEVSADYCVDRLLPILRRERWAVVLDGAEVVQHESGAWLGRFVHPELGRLLEELASTPLPGVVVVTSRFPLATLENRRHARLLALGTLDHASGRRLLAGLGARGDDASLDAAARSAGLHAKAVELLGTYLVGFRGGDAHRHDDVPLLTLPDASAEEVHVAQVLAAFQRDLPMESCDILALATAFRLPPTESRLCEYLASDPVWRLLHESWKREYAPFRNRGENWLSEQIQTLVALRLLERVGDRGMSGVVIDAHPLVRRGFENVLGPDQHTHGATARAGFLRGRPDRRPPVSLEDAREEVELFHAFCDAGLWNEADGTFVALDNPKHRFLAPAFERDLLLRFFPGGDFRARPLWPGFGRARSLAICLEMLGQFGDALDAYRDADAALRGDALIALGKLGDFDETPHMAHPWQSLWQCYRGHALAILGRQDEALALASAALPMDVYEWVHVFECFLRLGRLDRIDLSSLLYRRPFEADQRWTELARRRMAADHRRLVSGSSDAALGREYRELIEAYDRGGLAWERALTRLSYANWCLVTGNRDEARAAASAILEPARRLHMVIHEIDALELLAKIDGGDAELIKALRQSSGYWGPVRP